MRRHIISAVIAAATIAAFSGCGQKPPANTQSAINQQNLAVPSTQPATQPSVRIADVGSAEILPHKTQLWANQTEAWMSQRAKKHAESIADAIQPGDFHLGSAGTRKTDPPVAVVPISKPVVDQTPSSANTSSAIIAAQTQSPSITVGANSASAKLLADSAAQRTVVPDPSGQIDLSIARRFNDNPKDLWAALDYQLLQFLKDKPTPQLDVLARFSTEDRELISAVMDGLTNFRSSLRADNNMLMSKKVKPLLEMADRVRVQADLVIPTVALCTRVDGFGVYEPIDPPRFTAMREHPIIIYCEVENFSSHLNQKQQWETRLSQEVVLYTETGLPVWQDRTEKIPDFAKRRRHDFFIVKKTRFPANITIGRYLLKVTIVDQQANRVSEATIPVQFVAQ